MAVGGLHAAGRLHLQVGPQGVLLLLLETSALQRPPRPARVLSPPLLLLPVRRVNKPSVAYYTSPLTQNSYMLNTSKADRMQAESACIEWGGHLVSYISKEEQNDVGGCAALCNALPAAVLRRCALAAAAGGGGSHAWLLPTTGRAVLHLPGLPAAGVPQEVTHPAQPGVPKRAQSAPLLPAGAAPALAP